MLQQFIRRQEYDERLSDQLRDVTVLFGRMRSSLYVLFVN